jgi:hypothetical protein
MSSVQRGCFLIATRRFLINVQDGTIPSLMLALGAAGGESEAMDARGLAARGEKLLLRTALPYAVFHSNRLKQVGLIMI